MLVLDQRAFGGQAGASARIENYLGFPSGISGMALAGRAFNQALKFGAEIAIPLEVGKARLRRARPGSRRIRCRLQLHQWRFGARPDRRRCVRRPLPQAGDPEPRGLRGQGHFLLGIAGGGEALRGRGGCSGGRGQFRGTGRGVSGAEGEALASRGARAGPSKPRCRAISSTGSPPCPMLCCTPVPRWPSWKGTRPRALPRWFFATAPLGTTRTCPLRHLFLFIGADPNASWLNGCVEVDSKGFVVTGASKSRGDRANSRAILPLETSRPGIFAIGDVRAGSTKRVAAAVGEGAAAVAQIHTVLAAG